MMRQRSRDSISCPYGACNRVEARPGRVRRGREARRPRPRHGPGAQFHGDDVHAAVGHAGWGARGLLGGLTEQLVIIWINKTQQRLSTNVSPLASTLLNNAPRRARC